VCIWKGKLNYFYHATASRFLSKTTHRTKGKKEALLALFQSIQPNDTPKGMLSNARSRSEDLLSLFTFHLLRKQAIGLGASCLLTGETSTRMAVRVLESVGKGRGHKLPMEQGSIRWNGLFILRPLKDVVAKEVALYSRSKSLESLTPLEIVASQVLNGGQQDGGNGDKASMARLTESLIHLLERNVPSTVSTVNKVGEKLVFSNDYARHGYSNDDDEDNDDVEKSSVSFHQVGPSVPIRLRRRQDGSASAVIPSSSNGGQAKLGGAGDRSLQGLGLGRMGSVLYFAAKKMTPYHGALACPLCQMPSQRGLHAWKRGLTITYSKQEEDSIKLKHAKEINLTDLLCYACTIVLDTPESTKEGTTMALPPFVLHGALRRLSKKGGDGVLSVEEAATVDALVNGSSGGVKADHQAPHQNGSNKDVLHKLDRDQMKQHLEGFLLEEKDGQNTPSRERRQTDW
jgi:hypothetical protein